VEILAMIVAAVALYRPVVWLVRCVTAIAAWFLLLTIAGALLLGYPVGGVLALTVVLWLLSQVASRLTRGEWRSHTMRRAGQAMDAFRSAA
jgi:energy-converting hydrogenase Eha subunit G